MVKKDETAIRKWAHRLDYEGKDVMAEPDPWMLFKGNLTDKTWNAIITELQIKIDEKMDEINKGLENNIKEYAKNLPEDNIYREAIEKLK